MSQLNPDDAKRLLELRKLLEEKRDGVGDMTLEIEGLTEKMPADMNEFINRFMMGFKTFTGLKPGKKYGCVKETEARAILEALLEKNLSNDKVMDTRDAYAAADQFISLFLPERTFFKAGTFVKKGGSLQLVSFNPVTKSSMDAGIIIVDSKKIGMMWFCSDE